MNKKILIIIAVLFALVLTVGGTYAFFASQINTNNVTTRAMNFEVIYTGGEDINGNLKIIGQKEEGASTTVANIKMAEGSAQAKATLNLNISQISPAIATEGFIWEVEGYQGTTLVYSDSGNLDGASTGDIIPLVSNYSLSTTNTEFTFYFWLNGEYVGNEAIGSTFKGHISAETEYFNAVFE